MKYVAPALVILLLFSVAFDRQPQAQPQVPGLPPIAPYILTEPALSPDGATLAFIYDGDLWTVPSAGGTARRLTVTVGDESAPVFSPDGRWIAFASRRYGRDDIFVMPSEGGVARRLTFSDAWDSPCCWLPDSSGVIFTSFRREGGRDLYVVRLEGGEPWPITGGGYGVHELGATISPDGRHIAYVTGGGNTHRRRAYHGTASSKIWVCEFDGITTSNHRPLVATRSHSASPVFISNDEIVYVTHTNPDGSSNHLSTLARVNLRGRPMRGWDTGRRLDPRQLTFGGGKLAFSTGNYGGWALHVGELGRVPPQQITMPPIRINADVRVAEARATTLTRATEYAVSPDGKKIAFIAGGDVFVMAASENAVPLQVTDNVEVNSGIAWAPDSNRLLWVSTIRGRLYSSDLTTMGTGGPEIEQPELKVEGALAWPTVDRFGRVFAVVDEQEFREVWRVGDKADEAPESVPIRGYFHFTRIGSAGWNEYPFSSDGRWVLLRQPNALYNNVVTLGDTRTGELHAISYLFGTATTTRFSGDGKRVVFSNNQEGDYDAYVIDLEPKAPEFKEDELEKLFGGGRKTAKSEPDPKPDDDGSRDEQPAEEKAEEDEAEKETPKKTEIPEVRIAFDGIRDRVTRISSLSGNELWPVAFKDGKTYCFIAHVEGQANIWRLTLDPDKGPDLRQLTQSRTSKSHLTLSPDERTMWWIDNGRITSMNATGTPRVTNYDFRVTQRRDAEALRRAAFDEAVSVMGRYFYDGSYHGLDWYATAERYRPALEGVRNEAEYGALMNELLGELNSSHQGYTPPDDRSDGYTESNGWLGVIFDPVELSRGRYRINEVVAGGPLDLPEGKPEAGTWLVGLNGREFSRRENLASLLLDAAGRKTVLHLNSVPEFDGARELAVAPISRGELNQLWYRRWVEQQRAMVEDLSGGRLGYVHIRAMNAPSLREFKHHLGNAMLGKDGVVIDVRFNGGGSTAVDVLEILIKRPWLKRQRANLELVSENIFRSVALERPTLLMINHASFSNAEILAEGFRQLDIGPIVGVDTAGGVIGTGSYTLLDGSRMRLPSVGAYGVDGDNLELSGRKPDIYIENHPEELDQGIDRQTRAAVERLLALLDND